MVSEETATEVQVAIVGAGFSGLGMAIALRRDGNEDFVVLERAGALGGTWRDNGYPGCACDIPSILYSFSDAQNPSWTHAFAHQSEIWAYMRDVAARNDVERFMRFGHEVLAADWSEAAQRWEIETGRGRFTAEVLITGAGALAEPAIPALPGLDAFTGPAFHSARWDHAAQLDGRAVAVVGTGASAIQFVPEIAARVARLTVFQRTPPWVLPRANPPIPEPWRRRFRRSPRLLSVARSAVFSVQESAHVGFRHPAVMGVVERLARAHIARQVSDPALRERLTPRYRLGCKRVLGSDTWYPTLSRDNVDLVDDGIDRVTADGIIDGAGVHHPVDAIIFGTGFHVTDLPIAERIRGRRGASLAEVWQGSPQAHLGIGVNGFPNLFMLLGPNTGLGHNSVLLMIEAQIAYVRTLLGHRSQRGLAAVEPTAAAQARFVAEVDRGTQGSVWTAGGCLSWYVDASGRNSTLWPGSVRAYRRRLARFEPSDYDGEQPHPAPSRAPALA